MQDKGFADRVNQVVALIPRGRVMTYGQIVALCGSPRAARIVGGIAHYGDPSLPWQRVVNKKGGLASGYPGGRQSQANHLVTEGITITDNYYIEGLNSVLWSPNEGSHKL